MVRKSQSKLLTIYDNLVLRERIAKAIDDGANCDEIVRLCKTFHIDISLSTAERYINKRKEAIETGQDLRQLLDSDTEKVINNIKKKQVSPVGTVKEPELVKQESYSIEAMLDRLLKNGYAAMVDGKANIAPKDWVAMAKLFTQINGNNNHGLTAEGLQQLRLFQNAINQATISVINTYVPKDKQAEAINAIREEEQKRYNELDSSANGRALLKALNIGNIDI